MVNGVRPPLPTGGVKSEASNNTTGDIDRDPTSPYRTAPSLVSTVCLELIYD